MHSAKSGLAQVAVTSTALLLLSPYSEGQEIHHGCDLDNQKLE